MNNIMHFLSAFTAILFKNYQLNAVITGDQYFLSAVTTAVPKTTSSMLLYYQRWAQNRYFANSYL
jgi:hypothetical protein